MKGYKGNVLLMLLYGALTCGVFSCDTSGNTEDPGLKYFVKYYGGSGNQSGVDMLALGDGSFLLLGNYSENDFDSDIYTVQVDALGKVIRETRYRQDITNAKDIEPSGDGNFIILSDFQTTIGSQTDLKLIKVSPDGTMLDSVVFGSAVNDYGRTVTPLDDGGFIVSGTTIPNPPVENGDFINYRFNSDLEPLSLNEWSPISPGFEGKIEVAVKAIQIFEDNEFGVTEEKFYVFGYSNMNLHFKNPNEKLGLFYFKRSATGGETHPNYPGNIVNVDNTEIHFVDRVTPELGEGFILIGTSQNNMNVSEIFVAKLRRSLVFTGLDDVTLYNTIKLGRNVRGAAATSSVTGSFGYLVLGNEVRGTGALNIWLSKIDQSGNILWSSTFGSEAEEDTGSRVMELPDGKILILGTMGLADNQSKMALIKLNPQGELLP